MSISETKHVIINGDKSLFLSKNAIIRFKKFLKDSDEPEKLVIEDGLYLKEGYVFTHTFKDNTFNVNIITLEKHLLEEKRKQLRSRLKQANYMRSVQAKQELNSLKRSIPDKLFKTYMNLIKEFKFNDVPSPKDVINNPEKFKQQISMVMGKMGMLSNDSKANNSLKKYFNELGNFMGIEPAQMDVNQSSENIPVSSMYNVDEDTEDEDIPELETV